MASLLETIVARKSLHGGVTLSAAEVEHLVLTTVAAALDMACNAMINAGGNPTYPVREIIEPERILTEIKEDFTTTVQQYWPEPVKIGSARTEPYPIQFGENE